MNCVLPIKTKGFPDMKQKYFSGPFGMIFTSKPKLIIYCII